MSALAALRRRILTPDVSETRLDVRGFHVKDDASRDRLETVGSTFLAGFAVAAEVSRVSDATEPLERIPSNFKGFAYEGAAMAFAIRDGLPLGGRRHVAQFIAGAGERHSYMAYVGVGWAMARLPRMCWSALYGDDPLLRWLVLDGYGFHQAYFKTAKYVHQAYRHRDFPWPADDTSGYAPRVIDQGVGRATWFVAGTDPKRVVRFFEGFAEDRRPDLYAGAGLAATYAGGATEDELKWFRDAAAPYRADLAQGAAFAAGARHLAGLTSPHNELATRVFCGMSVAEASRVTDEARVGLTNVGVLPSYEVWRQRIASAFVESGPPRRHLPSGQKLSARTRSPQEENEIK
ncbi:DUF1702 family protein [Micromonospora sp. RHAY321]|uniref:DUF1702 family protein n=1 Tax=Micromonospora sp. RHAY321 TaxID=2944807 RepID=UPI00207CB83C|nr:DUF1702 family protein [Micromonospora sp. RHAY321]MCO1597558.1 DUF1702 family protein [Micromonospora sp. RHAY321]